MLRALAFVVRAGIAGAEAEADEDFSVALVTGFLALALATLARGVDMLRCEGLDSVSG